jgi:hypothetical protein
LRALRFLAALGGGRPNALFFAGDFGQRVLQQPFSWKALGVDIRGRSRTLRVNYRTSHQIREQVERLLGPEIADVDGNTENRSDTISVFNRPPFSCCPQTMTSERPSPAGSPPGRARVCCPTRSVCSSARPRGWIAQKPR